LPRRYCVRWGPRSPSPKGHSRQFSAHACCGQTAESIKMPHGREVGLDPGHILLDRNPAPLKGAQPPFFGPCLLWPNCWMDQDATWYEDRPRPWPHCFRWGPSPLPERGRAPSFWPMSIVAKRAPISATAELLYINEMGERSQTYRFGI